MFINTKVVLEKNKRFSESILWQYQMNYFEQEGVNAWVGQVPYYVTSNPHIASCYAEVIASYYLDIVKNGKYNPKFPLYILELGTGSGKFSFYLLKKILELIKVYLPKECKVFYIMSDFTENNITFWQQQPQLREFVDQGVLDFTQFNMISDTDIRLIESGKMLETADFDNGLVVIGNYIFDTVPHDVFHIKDQRLYEGRCFVETKKDNLNQLQPKDLSKLNVTFKHQAAKNYHDDYNEELVKVIDFYKESLSEGSLLIPITGIKTLDNLNKLSGENTLLISSDKGYTNLVEIENRSDPVVIFHGSFSMMVNFHAMGLYNEYKGGDAYFQDCHSGIASCALIRGNKLADMPHLTSALQEHFGNFSPAQYFHLHTYLRRDPIELDFNTIVSYLILSKWDPYVFSLLVNNLSKTIDQVSLSHLSVLDSGIQKICDNFYMMPNDEDVMFDIAYYFHLRQWYEEAIQYYQRSLDLFGGKYSGYYNIGICYFETSMFDEAMESFQRALNIDQNQPEAQKWLDRARMASRV